MELQSYDTTEKALSALSRQLASQVHRHGWKPFNLALSGGGTAGRLFEFWVAHPETAPAWDFVRFYWVDERCVAPEDPQSNYGEARRLLFEPSGIPPSHIHRIRGEREPEAEAARYTHLVDRRISSENGKPSFDCVILGVGNDLHTASIFPGQLPRFTQGGGYAASRHPDTGQRRVTMTVPLILGAASLLVPVVGRGKEDVIRRLAGNLTDDHSPAAYVLSHAPQAMVFAGGV